VRAAAGVVAVVILLGVIAMVITGPEATTARPVGIPAALPAPASGMTSPDSLPAASLRVSAQDARIANLKLLIELLLRGTQAQEAGKDATCWTTVRLMDAHFAGRPISDDVASVKIEACKTLVYQLWRRASLQGSAGRQSLQAEDIDAALPEELRESTELLNAAQPVSPVDPVHSVMDRDYQRITENRRYLIALAMEAVLGDGLFAGRQVDILPLSQPAAGQRARPWSPPGSWPAADASPDRPAMPRSRPRTSRRPSRPPSSNSS